MCINYSLNINLDSYEMFALIEGINLRINFIETILLELNPNNFDEIEEYNATKQFWTIRLESTQKARELLEKRTEL